ncbi:MAG: hypothetical protein V3R68_07915, partial [Gammaproteobacteria bacterium]
YGNVLLETILINLNLPVLTHRVSSRLRRDTLCLASCQQSRIWPHTWPARYSADIDSTPP